LKALKKYDSPTPHETARTGSAEKKKPTLLQMVLPKPPSPLPSVDSKDYARAWRTNLTFLRSVLPAGSQSLFIARARKYGNHIGVPIVCPHCEAKPEKHVPQHARWRWLSDHIVSRHSRPI
jgi:hypothetical protein